MINTFTFHLWIMDSGFISFHWSLEKYYCPNITAAFLSYSVSANRNSNDLVNF